MVLIQNRHGHGETITNFHGTLTMCCDVKLKLSYMCIVMILYCMKVHYGKLRKVGQQHRQVAGFVTTATATTTMTAGSLASGIGQCR